MIQLQFDNRFTRDLPADPDTTLTMRQVMGACFSRVTPRIASAPQLVSFSPDAAALIGLTEKDCRSAQFTRVLSGSALLDGMDPYAMCYGGHQFGNWAGQLGDGRAINLGEVVGAQQDTWALQLKGAGQTPYSRFADGLAVLRSSVREYLCSEAMYHLGVPTTRALSLILTGDQVERDMFYDGRPALEPGAVVCRMAPSFLRFGNFQLFAMRQDKPNLQRLVEFTMKNHFPDCGAADADGIVRMFNQVCELTADMIVHWMRVGFVHGVMNTDNMSILGLTIDYGPYGWLENYDPDWTPNTTDAQGRRYRFRNQPGIAQWNLLQLANALVLLTEQPQPLETALGGFVERFQNGYQQMRRHKLGFEAASDEVPETLIESLDDLLETVQPDMTLFYRTLADYPITTLADDHDVDIETHFADALYAALTPEHAQQLREWLDQYALLMRKTGRTDVDRRQRMNQVNPLYVMRNYLAQEAIDLAADGDFSRVNEQLDAIRSPYREQPGRAHLAGKRPEWALQKAGCSMLSCSS